MNSVNIKYTDAYLIKELEKYTSKDFFDISLKTSEVITSPL